MGGTLPDTQQAGLNKVVCYHLVVYYHLEGDPVISTPPESETPLQEDKS
jgi:hypothetical protein